MKNLSVLLLIIFTACTKESKQVTTESTDIFEKPSYDTTAIDSFSPGATSKSMELQMRLSARRYQDSLRALSEQTKDSVKAK